MKNKLVKILLIVVPIFFVGVFLYMTYFNAAYDHPGKYVYTNKCGGCHGEAGEGIQELVPPIVGSDMAKVQFDSLPCIILNGLNHPIVVNGKTYDQPMYPIALSEVEMANLLNYMAADLVHINRKYKSDTLGLMMKKCLKKAI